MADANDADLMSNITAFEAALTSEPTAIPDMPLRRVLLALDMSNQDPTALALARSLSVRAGAQLVLTHAYPGPRDEEREAYLSRRAEEAGATTLQGVGAHPFERVLSAIQACAPDLLVIPAPYLEDLETLGKDSLGHSLDLVLARARVPVLVVRQPLEAPEAALDDILIPITFANRENPRACGLALALVPPAGTITLLAIADQRALGLAAHLLGQYLAPEALDPSTLEALQAKEHAGLIAALQRTCTDRSVQCRVKVRVGVPLDTIREVAERRVRLVVVAAPEDPRAPAFLEVLAFLRDSSNPVLVV